MVDTKKELIVVGGANGSGKTTFVNSILKRRPMAYYGADLIAAEICPEAPETAAVAAGREFLLRVHQALAGDASCIVETTLSGRTFVKTMESAREAGWLVTIVYVYLMGGDDCVARVAQRVRKGGHHVDSEDVRRRYYRSLHNFWHSYRHAADDWYLAYNGSDEPIDVASCVDSNLKLWNADLFTEFLKQVGSAVDD